MADAIGSAVKLAIKKGGAWGTPVACGATNGFPFESEGLSPAATLIEDMQISGGGQQQSGDLGDKLFAGDVAMDLRYQGLEMLLANCMGTAGTPTQQGATAAYLHKLKVNDSILGKFLTFAFHKVVKIHEYPSVKVGGFSIRHTHNERAKLTLNLVANDLNVNGASGVNNTTTFADVTFPDLRSFLKFNHLAVKINEQSGGALADADKVYLMGYELTFTRNLKTDDVTTQLGNTIDEPSGDGFILTTGSLQFSKYQTMNDPIFLANLTKDRKKMIFEYTGPVASDPYTYKFNLYFPDVQFTDSPAPVGGPGYVAMTAAFKSHYVLSIPTGFPAGYTDQLTLEIVNLLATDPLG